MLKNSTIIGNKINDKINVNIYVEANLKKKLQLNFFLKVNLECTIYEKITAVGLATSKEKK